MKKLLALAVILSSATAKPPVQSITRMSSAPYISGDSFRAIANHVLDETDESLRPEEIQDKDIVFVKTDYVGKFFTQIHPHIQHKYILITHNSDCAAPGSFEHYLDDEKLIAWFGQNPTLQNHKKFVPIPIGIANRVWSHGNVANFNKATELARSMSRHVLLGINFVVGSNRDLRQPVYDYFITKHFCTNLYHREHFDYLKNMAKANFILSPAGNGLDCHRTWEALLLGAIPILKTSPLDELLQDLPVLIINDWSEITEGFLRNKLEEIRSKTWIPEKKYFNYWQQVIYRYRDA